jgi:hypothetical protein
MAIEAGISAVILTKSPGEYKQAVAPAWKWVTKGRLQVVETSEIF